MYHWFNCFILAAALIHMTENFDANSQGVKDRIGACEGHEAENTALLNSIYLTVSE